MKAILPPNLSEKTFTRALSAFERAVGKEWVLATDEDRQTYVDAYSPGDEANHAPLAAVAPASTEEVQAVVKLANEHRVPLWPISRGKNLGYGGSAPRMSGSVILDLSRMKRILEVNEEFAYCVVEPGVGFFDLYEHIKSRKLPLWMAIPGNAWGSVLGNALERGFSATPYGDHSAQICGMEVVLPNGELVRTGMGAMNGNPTWVLFKHGFGASWDQMFVQSNFGVVTKMGLWLMPQPESVFTLSMGLPNPDDLGWLIDVLRPLRISRVIDHPVSIPSYMNAVTTSSQRNEWYQGEDSLPDEVVRQILTKRNTGWWNPAIRLYGLPEVNEAHLRVIQSAFARHTKQEFAVSRWRADDPAAGPGAPEPTVFPLQIVNWHGGRGGHLGFSPIMPPGGKLVLEQFHRTRKRFFEYGIDYSGTFYVNGRYIVNTNLLLYDRDNTAMTRRVRDLFDTLVKDSAAHGYAEYRTHLTYMDQVAGTFNYNSHALRRLNETVKDTLDPNGILAPGKNGIWPKGYRGKG